MCMYTLQSLGQNKESHFDALFDARFVNLCVFLLQTERNSFFGKQTASHSANLCGVKK